MEIHNVIFEDDIKNCIKKVQEVFDFLIENNASLIKQLSEYDRDSEIKKRDDKINELYRKSIGILAGKEYDLNNNFIARHRKSCNNPNHYVYDLFETGIGMITKIRCPVCGEEEDITDSDCW